jgi:hypothetical protein
MPRGRYKHWRGDDDRRREWKEDRREAKQAWKEARREERKAWKEDRRDDRGRGRGRRD